MRLTKFFSQEKFLDSIEEHYCNPNRQFFKVRLNDGPPIRLVRDSIELEGLGELKVIRYAGCFLADYFNIPTETDLISKILSDSDADLVVLSNIVGGTDLDHATDSKGYKLSGTRTYGLSTSEGFQAYLQTLSKTTRRTCRRKLREAEERGQFSERTAQEKDIEWILEHQAKRAVWKEYDKLRDEKPFVNTLYSICGSEELRIAEYQVKGRTAAMLLVIHDNNCYSVYSQAFDEELHKHSPSFSALIWLIRQAHDQGIEYVDLLRGDEEYKKSIAKNVVQLYKSVNVLRQELDTNKVLTAVENWEE